MTGTGEDLEGSSGGLIEILPRNLSVKTQKEGDKPLGYSVPPFDIHR
jgi:hypothetical protein